MGNTTNCCERDENIDNIIEERNEIFNFSPEDDKIPDDASFISNQGGEYPIETELPADFRYEAKYPNLVNSEKIVIKNLPQDKIYENDEEEDDLNQEMKFMEKQNNFEANKIQKGQMMKLKQLFDICYRNGKPRPCDDFNPKGYTMFYSEYDPYFYIDKNECFPNNLKIYNQDDKNNLQIYQGEVNAAGQRHGIGKCTTPYYVLMGMWKNDKFSGWGRESRSNGEVYEGRYENGLLNGKGIFLNEKKCKYIGDFMYTRKWGKGELTTNKIIYKGDFYDNQLHGNGKIQFLADGIMYKGTFKHDQIDGKGIFTWRNGDIYIGQVKNGKMHGRGKYIRKNGKQYEGIFHDGEKMSDKIEKYKTWASTGYGVNQNSNKQAIQSFNTQTQFKSNVIRQISRPESNAQENMRQNSIQSDFRNNGFNQNDNISSNK